jgi:hypothetical protein
MPDNLEWRRHHLSDTYDVHPKINDIRLVVVVFPGHDRWCWVVGVAHTDIIVGEGFAADCQEAQAAAEACVETLGDDDADWS